MNLKITDTCITLEEGAQVYTLLEKPKVPDYSNVTARPYISAYPVVTTTIWENFCSCMENLPVSCPDDAYLGCYALIFRRLYSLLLSSSQAKNVVSYGLPVNCGAYNSFQKFMSFLQEGNALTALAQSSFSLLTVAECSCHAFLYCLDVWPALPAVCDAISKVRPGGHLLLYTRMETLPAELADLCAQAQKDSFGSCILYTFSVDGSLTEFALANDTAAFLLPHTAEITKRAEDLQGLIQAMLAGAALPGDAYFIAVTILQQTEELLLSLYDYLEDDGLPVRANALKEAVLNYYVGIVRHCDLTSYREKLTQSSEIFFDAVGKEFPQ